MTDAPATANRDADGVYHSTFPPLPHVEPGTVFDYVYGRLCLIHGKDGSEERASLIDFSTKRTWTKQQARDIVVRVAATLLTQYNCKPGDHVMICYPTTATFAILCYACARAGLVMALSNPAYTPDEVRHTTSLVGAKIVLTHEQLKPTFQRAGVDVSKLVEASLPEATSTNDDRNALHKNLVSSVDEAERILERAGANKIEWTSPFGIFFSSGTTGLPKGVVVSHRNVIMLIHSLRNVPGYLTPETWNDGWPTNGVVYLPGFHIAGLATIAISGAEGSSLAFAVTSPMDLPLVVRCIKEYRPYRNAIVPPLLLALTRLKLAGPKGLSDSMGGLLSAAAPLGSGLQREAQTTLKIPIGQMWGLSETTGAVTCSDITRDTRAGSGGQIMPGMQMRIVNEDGSSVAHGTPGEIFMRGPLTMSGYYRNEKETAETLDKDGWLHTGDIGYMDDDGFLFIVDRRKELIKYKGFQVAPAELEALLLEHPAVGDVGVTGVVEDEVVGEVPRAFVVLSPGHVKNADEDTKRQIRSLQAASKSVQRASCKTSKDIEAFVASRVVNYKQLRGGIVFLEEIPKNPSGKILRRVLRNLGKEGEEKAKL